MSDCVPTRTDDPILEPSRIVTWWPHSKRSPIVTPAYTTLWLRITACEPIETTPPHSSRDRCSTRLAEIRGRRATRRRFPRRERPCRGRHRTADRHAVADGGRGLTTAVGWMPDCVMCSREDLRTRCDYRPGRERQRPPDRDRPDRDLGARCIVREFASIDPRCRSPTTSRSEPAPAFSRACGSIAPPLSARTRPSRRAPPSVAARSLRLGPWSRATFPPGRSSAGAQPGSWDTSIRSVLPSRESRRR